MGHVLSCLSSFFQKILYFVYPVLCRNCNFLISRNNVFCSKCSSQLLPIASYNLKITKSTSIKVFAISKYEGSTKKLIHGKFFGDISASVAIGKLIYEQTIIKNLNIDFIVPIPLHWTRYAARGFNQAEVIANEISKNIGVPVLKILKRSKKTNFQSSLPINMREKNIKNAFVVSKKFKSLELKDKNILIVDDLLTSGATISEAGRLILNFKPKFVFGAVAARAF